MCCTFTFNLVFNLLSKTSPTIFFSSTSCHSSEHSLAIILAAIVFVFMICHACRFFLAFYQVKIHTYCELIQTNYDLQTLMLRC